MKKYIITLSCLIFSILVFSQHTNVMISNTNNPEEPSIFINPKNTDIIVAAANINSYYYSTDAGFSWNEGSLTSASYGVWGDPCVIIDTSGYFYFFHLSNPASGHWIDRIVCQRSLDNGLTWNDGSFAGLNGAKSQDKEWAIVDRTNNNIYMSWTQFDEYGSSNTDLYSNILFSKSYDQGISWSEPVRINKVSGDCVDSDNTVEGAVPAIGPNGEIYVAWAGPLGILFDKSLDQGETWLDDDIFVSDIPGGWDYAVTGISRCNGLPVTKCDLSNGPDNGSIYINWTDQRNGEDDTDVWLSKSTDNGATWSDPVRVNDDSPGKQQFFTWMDIDSETGYLYFVFYDRRNYDDNNTDVFMAVSRDGGNSFINFKISESPFLPNSSVFFGDYTNISVHNNVIRPMWARLDNYNLSVWTAIVNPDIVGIENNNLEKIFTLEQNYPNPLKYSSCFSFKIYKPSFITLKISDVQGREIYKIIDNKFMNPGKYVEHFDRTDVELKSGIYYFSLIDNEHSIKRKMIVLE